MRGLELAPLCVPPCEQEAAEEEGEEEVVVVVVRLLFVAAGAENVSQALISCVPWIDHRDITRRVSRVICVVVRRIVSSPCPTDQSYDVALDVTTTRSPRDAEDARRHYAVERLSSSP